jgi:hypothetical protein
MPAVVIFPFFAHFGAQHIFLSCARSMPFARAVAAAAAPTAEPASQQAHNQSSSVSAEMNESVHQKAIIAHQDALICIRPHDKGREKALIYTHTRARSAFAARRSLSALTPTSMLPLRTTNNPYTMLTS